MRKQEDGRVGSGGVRGGRATGTVVPVVPSPVGGRGDGALATFRDLLGDLWPVVSQWCVLLDADGMTALSERLERHMHDHPGSAERVLELANDLMALMAGWEHFGSQERQVLAGAMGYLVAVDDAVPDDQPGGLEDDDRVVEAAVRAVLRRRSKAS